MELSVVLTGASFHFLPLNSPPYPFIFPTTCYSLIFKLYLVNFCLLTSNLTLIIYLSVGKYFFPNGDSSRKHFPGHRGMAMPDRFWVKLENQTNFE